MNRHLCLLLSFILIISCNRDVSQSSKQETKKYFTIGSTEEEVVAVMGELTTFAISAPASKRIHFGLSMVYLYKGKVISYDNLQDNLKVK